MTGPRRMWRIARGAASAIEREDGRPDPLRFLARLGCGWVPDHCAECVCLGAAPIIWLDWDKISLATPTLKTASARAGTPSRGESATAPEPPFCVPQMADFDTQRYTGTGLPTTKRHVQSGEA